MKTHIYSYVLAFFAFLFIAVSPTFAQNATDFEGLRFVCVNQTWCRDSNDCSVKNAHRAKLTMRADVKAIPNDSNTYLTECFEYEKDDELVTTCTTGNPDLDRELFCTPDNVTEQCNHLATLEDDIDYSLEEGKYENYGVHYFENGQWIEKNPPVKISTNANGDMIPSVIEWQSYTPKEHVRKFLLWNKTTNREDQQPVSSSGLGGQQQADLNFLFRSSSCAGQSWDPYGKVFDMSTLEPLAGVKVALKQYNPTSRQYEATYANTNNFNIDNPFETTILGKFNFIVQDGDYTLTPSLEGYIHPASQVGAALSPEIRARMNKIYTNIYYNDSDPIRQRGVIQQRDIPMQLSGGPKQENKIKILSELEQVQPNGNVIYSGMVSHPFAELKVEICEPNGTCAKPVIYTQQQGAPDKDGKFSVLIEQVNLAQGQTIKQTFTKVNLTTIPLTSIPSWVTKTISFLTSFIGTVEAQESANSTSRTSQPIPTYLEGYAYDTEGNILPNAIVGIYVDFSNKPLYQTRANAQGYFKITSDKLPTTGYSIGYAAAPNQKAMSKVTTSQFLQQNKEFTTAEKVNPFMFATTSTDPRRNVTPAYVPQSKVSPVANQFQETQPSITATPSEQAVSQPANNNMLLIGAILLLLVATVGTLIGVYLYKKKAQGMSNE